MRAAVLHGFHQPMVLEEAPRPIPQEDEVLVRVMATGLCGTDLKIVDGLFAAETPLPLILGHEVAGEVVNDAGDLHAGQRVACYKDITCGECAYCTSGQETLCVVSRRVGFNVDGGLAEYVKIPTRNALPISSSMPPEVAAVCMDAVLSPWRALLTRARLMSGERLVIAGAGGLGINAIQIAVTAGARVAVIEPQASHRDLALSSGAELVVHPDDSDQVHEWSSGGADVGFEASGTKAGFDALLSCLRPGARLVCCGYRPKVRFDVDSASLVLNEISIIGSRAGNREEARAALQAAEEGRISPPIGRQLPLDEVNDGIRILRDGRVEGRVVIRISGP